MPYYPVNLEITHRPCMVVGGGAVAQRKALALMAAGARVTIVSPEITLQLAQLTQQGKMRHINRSYEKGDAVGFFIVICATNNKAVNQLIAEEANKAGSLVNVIDAPELGNFTVPSQIVHGDLLITISTGGKSPALTKRLREELSKQYGPEYGVYLDLVAKARTKMKSRLHSSKERETFWRQTIDHEVIGLLKEGKLKEAEARINNAIGCSGAQS